MENIFKYLLNKNEVNDIKASNDINKKGMTTPEEFAQFLLDHTRNINTKENMKKVMEYIYNRISNDYKITKTFPPIKYDNSLPSRNAYYNATDNVIFLSDSAFNYNLTDSPLVPISSLIHEMRHFAQLNGKRLDNQPSLRYTQTNTNYNVSDLSTALAIQSLNPLTCTKDSEKITPEKLYSADIKYFAYFNNRYYSQDLEMDARSYTLSELSEIFDVFHKIKLNPTNKLMADLYENSVSNLFEQEQNILMHLNTYLDDKKIAQENINYRATILRDNPKLFELIKTNKTEKLNKKYGVDITNTLVESIINDYDETFARNLFNALLFSLKEKRDEKNMKIVTNMITHSAYSPSLIEITTFNSLLKDSYSIATK